MYEAIIRDLRYMYNMEEREQNCFLFLQTYYTNEEGELVTVSLFDLTNMQDPTDLIGDDALEPEINTDGYDLDKSLIEERLKHLHSLYGNNIQG